MKSSKLTFKVGTATCGRSVGALEVLDVIRESVNALALDCKVEEVGCLGHCYAEPMVAVGNDAEGYDVYGYLDVVSARALVENLVHNAPYLRAFRLGRLDEDGSIISAGLESRNAVEQRLILRNCGVIDPLSLEAYEHAGGYAALRKALALAPGAIIDELDAARLRGRGGAGFPTGRKWRSCAEAPGGEKYIICNADEGDPGAFMDRTLLESDPQSVIEGMAIAGFAVGASRGIVYVRAEYPLACERMRDAVGQAESAGYLGENILGSGFDFTIEVFSAAGAFVCGEETAMIASLEGNRGIPYPRPPHPSEQGLWDRPSVIDNVKTYAYVRHIVNEGAAWLASIGTQGSTGTAVFALAGQVARPGLVEVPMGATIRELVFDVGGGIANPNRDHPRRSVDSGVGWSILVSRKKRPIPQFKFVQIGGPSGGCLPEALLDTPVDFDSLQRAGAMMGSGGLVVMSDEDCAVETARYFLEFTCGESCGKCTMCREGTKQMLSILEGITRGEGTAADLDELEVLGRDVKAGSACNLGRTAPNPVLTTLRYFRDEYEAHLDQLCPGLTCKELISYEFNDVGCWSVCDECCIVCDAIRSYTGYDGRRGMITRIHEIDDELCVRCGICMDSCMGSNYSVVHKVTPAKRRTTAHVQG